MNHFSGSEWWKDWNLVSCRECGRCCFTFMSPNTNWHCLLTSDEYVLCIAQNGIITELELFLVLNQRPALSSQSTDQFRQLHEAVTLVDLINSHIHHTECPRSPHTIATAAQHSQHKFTVFTTYHTMFLFFHFKLRNCLIHKSFPPQTGCTSSTGLASKVCFFRNSFAHCPIFVLLSFH